MLRLNAAGNRVASIVLMGIALFSLLAAMLYPGTRATEVNLNDGGVWVTNAKKKLVAHLNYSAQEFDAALRVTESHIDVFQDANNVYVADRNAATLARVDVTKTALGGEVANKGLESAIYGDKALFTSAELGKVWVQDPAHLRAVSVDKDTPVISGMPQPVAVASTKGTVFAVSARTSMLAIAEDGMRADEATMLDLPGLSPASDLQITAVGETPVVLDRTTGTLYLSTDRTLTIPNPERAQLQEPSAGRGYVLVATSDEMLAVPLDGGEPRIVEAPVSGGVPVRPVQMGTCAYSAWMGTGAFLRDCDDDARDEQLTVDTLARSQKSVFRVNRSTIVLNDIDTGHLWLPDNKMLLVEDWDQIESTLQSDQEDDNDDSATEDTDVALPDHSEENTPPIARDDVFGVRAGRSNVLPVLNNDSDVDGDYIVITNVESTPLGNISISRDGTSLSLRIPEGATGSAVLRYEISDGRGGTASANMTVTIHGNEVNSAPVQLSKTSVSLNPARTVSVNTLQNWYDPDGDPFYLAGIVVPEGITARFQETGTVDVTENGHGLGENVIEVRVSDGRDIGEGQLGVTIRNEDNLPPVANTDHVVVPLGQSVSLSPLDNDTDPNGDPLRLVQVDSGNASVSARLDGALGSVTVTGHAVGTYYLGYVITDNPTSVKGYIRVDVIQIPENVDPTAEDDLGVLPEVGQVVVDLTANDYDPTGGVLTVQSLQLPNNSPLHVTLIDRHIARITAPQGLNANAGFTYTVTNGRAQTSAYVTVVPGPATDSTAPPLLTEDHLVVRVGDVGSVPVLANDRSPLGLALNVNSTMRVMMEPEVGTAFISDNVVRVRGGSKPGVGKIDYTVTDTAGNMATSTVHVTVVPLDDEDNTAPIPRILTARTMAGQQVRIPVPLDGIDREGDSVTLVGLGSSPKMGTVEQNGDSFIYRAAQEGAGTDTFSYVVEDRRGKRATGSIRVGISPASTTNQTPVAINDEVTIRPGTRVSIPVMENDIDPDGDALKLLPDRIASNEAALEPSGRGGTIILKAPTTEGTYILTYAIEDTHGATAEGVLTVVVSAAAPLRAPIARDDYLTEAQILAAKRDGKITVDVRANDADPDGDIGQATVTTNDATAKVSPDGNLTVTLTEQPQIIIYTLTDPDGLVASAFLRVPGVDPSRPTLDLSASTIRVKAGERIDIPLNDYIRSRDGRPVQLVSLTSVSVGIGSDGSNLVKDRQTLTFRSTPEFSGATSITAEVTDAQGANDQNATSATVTLPIEVEAAANRNPVLRLSPVALEQGGAPLTINLSLAASDPDPADAGRLSFSLTSQSSSGVTASLNGTQLTLTAAKDAVVGANNGISVRVSDPQGGSAEAPLPITVRAGAVFPLIQTTDVRLILNGTEEQSVDVTKYATHPNPEKPVRLTGVPTATAGGRVTVEGNTLNIRAEEEFTGIFSVSYTVTDGEASEGRQVPGRIVATVRTRPGAPQSLTVMPLTPTEVRLSWRSGTNGGTPISDFIVTDHTQGDTFNCGPVTSCIMTVRLTGRVHSFSVVAVNAVGQSDPTPRVETSLDVVPPQPAPPRLNVGDRSATVSWVRPAEHQGSEITSYEVELSPGHKKAIAAEGPGPYSLTFEGLTNGMSYSATVRALNGEGASPWSVPSASGTPYGSPGPVSNLRVRPASGVPTGAGTAAVVVEWSPASPNGRAIERYTVEAAGITQHVPADGSNTVTLAGIPLSSEQVTFTVVATNDVTRPAEFTSPPVSVTQWVLGEIPAPTISSVRATGVDNQVELNWSYSPDANGWLQHELDYQWSVDGGQWQALSGSTLTGSGLSNGQSTRIHIRAVGHKLGENSYSADVVSAPVVPHGQPIASELNCQPQAKAIACSWSGGSGNGLPATFTFTTPTNMVVEDHGTHTFPVSPGQTVTVCIEVKQPQTGARVLTCQAVTVQPDVTPPTDLRPISARHKGLTVTITTKNYSNPGWTSFHCWNAATPADMRAPSADGTDPGNYLGEHFRAEYIPSTGEVTITCSGNPIDRTMGPNEDFHIQLFNMGEWTAPRQ